MPAFELNRKLLLGEAAWPVAGLHARIDIELDVVSGVPGKAARRLALMHLRELVAELEEDELTTLSHPLGDAAGRDNWDKPDLDLRVIKSAHRVVSEVAKRGVSGREVLASELVGSIGLSAPTLGRLLRDGEQGFDYLSQFVRVTPSGRTKALDLTADGRLLASQIRAGTVPA